MGKRGFFNVSKKSGGGLAARSRKRLRLGVQTPARRVYFSVS